MPRISTSRLKKAFKLKLFEDHKDGGMENDEGRVNGIEAAKVKRIYWGPQGNPRGTMVERKGDGDTWWEKETKDPRRRAIRYYCDGRRMPGPTPSQISSEDEDPEATKLRLEEEYGEEAMWPPQFPPEFQEVLDLERRARQEAQAELELRGNQLEVEHLRHAKHQCAMPPPGARPSPSIVKGIPSRVPLPPTPNPSNRRTSTYSASVSTQRSGIAASTSNAVSLSHHTRSVSNMDSLQHYPRSATLANIPSHHARSSSNADSLPHHALSDSISKIGSRASWTPRLGHQEPMFTKGPYVASPLQSQSVQSLPSRTHHQTSSVSGSLISHTALPKPNPCSYEETLALVGKCPWDFHFDSSGGCSHPVAWLSKWDKQQRAWCFLEITEEALKSPVDCGKWQWHLPPKAQLREDSIERKLIKEALRFNPGPLRGPGRRYSVSPLGFVAVPTKTIAPKQEKSTPESNPRAVSSTEVSSVKRQSNVDLPATTLISAKPRISAQPSLANQQSGVDISSEALATLEPKISTEVSLIKQQNSVGLSSQALAPLKPKISTQVVRQPRNVGLPSKALTTLKPKLSKIDEWGDNVSEEEWHGASSEITVSAPKPKSSIMNGSSHGVEAFAKDKQGNNGSLSKSTSNLPVSKSKVSTIDEWGDNDSNAQLPSKTSKPAPNITTSKPATVIDDWGDGDSTSHASTQKSSVELKANGTNGKENSLTSQKEWGLTQIDGLSYYKNIKSGMMIDPKHVKVEKKGQSVHEIKKGVIIFEEKNKTDSLAQGPVAGAPKQKAGDSKAGVLNPSDPNGKAAPSKANAHNHTASKSNTPAKAAVNGTSKPVAPSTNTSASTKAIVHSSSGSKAIVSKPTTSKGSTSSLDNKLSTSNVVSSKISPAPRKTAGNTHEEEPTEVKLVLLASKYPELEHTMLLEVLTAHGGSVERVLEAFAQEQSLAKATDTLSLKQTASSSKQQSTMRYEDEPTDYKLAIMLSEYPKIDQTTLLDILLAYDGDVVEAMSVLAQEQSAGKPASSTVVKQKVSSPKEQAVNEKVVSKSIVTATSKSKSQSAVANQQIPPKIVAKPVATAASNSKSQPAVANKQIPPKIVAKPVATAASNSKSQPAVANKQIPPKVVAKPVANAASSSKLQPAVDNQTPLKAVVKSTVRAASDSKPQPAVGNQASLKSVAKSVVSGASNSNPTSSQTTPSQTQIMSTKLDTSKPNLSVVTNLPEKKIYEYPRDDIPGSETSSYVRMPDFGHYMTEMHYQKQAQARKDDERVALSLGLKVLGGFGTPEHVSIFMGLMGFERSNGTKDEGWEDLSAVHLEKLKKADKRERARAAQEYPFPQMPTSRATTNIVHRT